MPRASERKKAGPPVRRYRVAEIFYQGWGELPADLAAAVLARKDEYERAKATGQDRMQGAHVLALTGLLCKRRKVWLQLSPVQLVQALADLKWMDQPWHDFHVTWLKTRRGKIVAPDTKLNDLTLWQVAWADAEYSRYVQALWALREGRGRTEDVRTAMRRLIAALYRYEGREFDEREITPTVMALPDIGPKMEGLIARTYGHCRAYMMKRCPTLFPANAGKSVGVEGAEPPKYTGPMWQAAVMDLADMPAYGSMEKAKKAPLYEALDYLEKKAKDLDEMKKQQKR